MKALQYPSTSLSCPQWQAGTFRNPFERDVICNDYKGLYQVIYLSVMYLKDEVKESLAGLGWRI